MDKKTTENSIDRLNHSHTHIMYQFHIDSCYFIPDFKMWFFSHNGRVHVSSSSFFKIKTVKLVFISFGKISGCKISNVCVFGYVTV